MMRVRSAAGRRIGTGRFQRRPMSEINVTPFVDVMLVLLVVFMIAAPLLSVGVPVELPRSDESAPLPADQQIVTISVTKEGRVFLQDNEVVLEELPARLRSLRIGADGGEGQSDAASEAGEAGEAGVVAIRAYTGSIYVRGDSQAQYGLMARIIASVKAAGYRRIGFITENNPEP